MYLDYTELKLYMTRDALRELAERLVAISEAPAEECYEIHVRAAFSEFDMKENYVRPPLKSSGGVKALFEKMHEEALREAIERGEEPPYVQPSPFELTFMHVTGEAVREAATWPDD
ncbi:hypothetical protein [Pseudaminobacter soli (ex Li et al. 2025)]|uniref:Uncharacterized protein n=1 Tax=Pseudaminobacter soli (ex Li et al. 2025) TaxID=1295366 RepID=A0A2P7RNE3_9HYPH|nr:hypothetical protein [Mesorhizobium soli]PSJ51729.1 hypothetical protein C7I85_29390 [Mesorhizobium soli]